MVAIKTLLILTIQGLLAHSDHPHTTTASISYTGATATASSDSVAASTTITSASYTSSSVDTGSATATSYSAGTSATPTDSSSSSPTSASSSCSGAGYNQVNITSPNKIKTGKDFTISWTSPQPDPSKNHTEARVELWALNAGPVNSPLLAYKSDRLFDTSNYTYNFATSNANATTRGGGIIWQLYVAVYSTYYSSNITDLESWNLPYYGLQKVTFQ